MARLIAAIIRHGDYYQLPDTPSAHQPFPLTDEGKAQAEAAAVSIRKTLAQQQWQLHHELDCSQLQRAWQTADILRERLQDCFAEPASLQETAALAERGLGIAANLTVSRIEAVLADDARYAAPPADWKSNSYYCLPLPGAESLMSAGQRVADHINARVTALKEQITKDTLQLFVGHGAAFRHAAYHMGVLEFEQIARLSMYHAEPVYLEYHGKTGWQHIDGHWKVRRQGSDYKD